MRGAISSGVSASKAHGIHILPMVSAGTVEWGSSDLQRRAQEVVARFTGRVAPKHLPALYRQAALFVYPSLYDGFGLPPIEAMAGGTPLVASNTTSLPEILRDTFATPSSIYSNVSRGTPVNRLKSSSLSV